MANFPGEEDDQNAIGIKKAAIRRLNYELGIPLDSIPFDNMHYITRVHYKDEGNFISNAVQPGFQSTYSK